MPSQTLNLVLADGIADERLDSVLARLLPDHSRSFLQRLIKEGGVRCDGRIVRLPRQAVRSGQQLTVELPEAAAEPASPAPEHFDFPILFEDESLLVIDKPPGVVVHPAAGNPAGTVANAVAGRHPELLAELDGEALRRPGIVHRLDKDTSGCLLIAKNASVQFKLAQLFAGREVSKKYLAVVRGAPKERKREIETLIGRHPVNRQKMAVVKRGGKEARTRYRVTGGGLIDKIAFSVLDVDIFTGRTHQIRVHLASIGHPVLGDEVYGGAVPAVPVPRQMLHAWKLWLPHPVTGETLHVVAPPPPDLAAILDQLEGRGEG